MCSDMNLVNDYSVKLEDLGDDVSELLPVAGVVGVDR